MRNFKVMMAYNGAAYHGFQSQNNALTVQDTVEAALKTLIGEEISINGCSRTDAGVHAKNYCFSMTTENGITCGGFKRGMNGLLPGDIAILSCEEAAEDFHARFSSKGKEYLYLIRCGREKDVFMEKMAFFYPYSLDIEKMKSAARLMVGEHDFGAFCKAEAKEHLTTTVRTVTDIRLEKSGDNVEIYVGGTGFLHNMVRIIVGTLIYVSEGKRSEADIAEALSTGKREKAGKTLSPYGLYLNKVFY